MTILRTLAIPLSLIALLAACDGESQPLASVGGGGFIFNYRLGEAYYGIVVTTSRGLPEGSIIDASFENPAGGAPIVVSQAGKPEQRKYVFRTPALKGVKKDVPYKVVVQALDHPGGKELAHLEHSFKSSFDQSIIAGGPLVVGPGYTPNPDNDITKPAAN
jgi:hypothetical protein